MLLSALVCTPVQLWSFCFLLAEYYGQWCTKPVITGWIELKFLQKLKEKRKEGRRGIAGGRGGGEKYGCFLKTLPRKYMKSHCNP